MVSATPEIINDQISTARTIATRIATPADWYASETRLPSLTSDTTSWSGSASVTTRAARSS